MRLLILRMLYVHLIYGLNNIRLRKTLHHGYILKLYDSTQSLTKGNTLRREGLGKPKGSLSSNTKYTLERHTLSGLPERDKYLVLGIETSCDDTGAAVVSSDGEILSNVVISQVSDLHLTIIVFTVLNLF